MEKHHINPIFSVSDFVAVINQTLEFAYPSIMVEGEVAEYKVSQNKWVYFKLKDATSTVDCFMTLWQVRMPIEDGMRVIVQASPKLTNWGRFSLTVKNIRPSGEGALKKSFEILKLKLETEGLFTTERKRQLSRIPTHVAIISSTQAAGYADFIKILNDRWGGIKVDVAHVQVQGADAPDQMIRAIEYFNQQEVLPEVLVIIRGGGSADDLSAFNDEPLVRAIAGSRVPTLVGVGHEINESLADLAADVSAATPSNAAQILVPDKFEIIRSVKAQLNALLPRMLQAIDQRKQFIENEVTRIFSVVERNIDDQINRINSTRSILAQLNPNTILARGYALIRGEIKLGNNIEIETNKAILKAEVKNVINK